MIKSLLAAGPKLYRAIIPAIANSHFKRETVKDWTARIDDMAAKMLVADNDDDK
jgi:hypothetical protein